VLATFWQGEFAWHHQPLAFPVVNVIYVLLSVGLMGIALMNLRPASLSATAAQRRESWFSFGLVAAAILFLGLLSVIYDFHDCAYPSREHPYFTSGRLMLGALIPFLILFVFGLDRVLGPVQSWRVKRLVLAGLILFMLISEIATDWPVFSTRYNWFHL
jgi:hypothetical protein